MVGDTIEPAFSGILVNVSFALEVWRLCVVFTDFRGIDTTVLVIVRLPN